MTRAEHAGARAGPAGTAGIVVVGVAAGGLAGIFGVGGGLLLVPGLVMVLAMDQRLAHGTSLAAIVPIALAGVAGYALDGKVDWAVTLALVAGAAGVGAPLGTRLLHVLPQRVLALCFAAVLLLTAVRLVVGHSDGGTEVEASAVTLAALVLVGVVAGTTAGLLGVGGGVIMVPAMILLVGAPAAVAKGSSLAVIIPTAVVGTVANVRRGNADLRAAATIGAAGVVSSFAAALVSVGLDERLSNRLFALLLVAVGGKMVWDHRRPAGDRTRGTGVTPAP